MDVIAEAHQETRRELHTLTQQAIRRLDILAESDADTGRQMRSLHDDLATRLGHLQEALHQRRKS